MDPLALIIPSFIAGILTFLAPCTLPMVPGYLGFISGVSLADLQDPQRAGRARRRIFVNGVLFILGFSAVFILLGSLFGLGGAALVKYRIWLARVGGILVIFFGLYMLGIFKLPFLQFLGRERRIPLGTHLKPGSPLSSLIFGAAFAGGWTPCVGPILGSILLLSSTTGTVGQGALLLAVFSAGLAVPFLLIALGIGSAARAIRRFSRVLNIISVIGGIFLILLGILLFTNKMALLIAYGYRALDFINYDRLLDYL